MFKLIKRAGLLLAIRALEIEIYGKHECMACVVDKFTIANMELSIIIARRELARLRGEYNSTFKPGTRKTWGYA